MFCPNCGKQLPENGNFCPNCGEKLMAAPQAQPVQPVQVPPVQVPTVSVQPEVPAQPVKKKSKKGLIIGLSVGGGVLVILLAVIVAVFVLLGGGKTPTMTYKGMTFSYGMEIDLDKLERKFPEMEVVGRGTYWLDDGVAIFLRQDERTGKMKLAAVYLNQESSAKMNGVSIGDSERSFCAAFPQADHPISPDGTVVISLDYSFYIYEGEVYHPGPFGELLYEAQRSGDDEKIRALNTETLMFSATVRDGEVVYMAFGDIFALKYVM